MSNVIDAFKKSVNICFNTFADVTINRDYDN